MSNQTDLPAYDYTDAEAVDEAILLFTRKVRRLHPNAFADVIARLPQGAQDALTLAENRADVVRSRAKRSGITRSFPVDEELTED